MIKILRIPQWLKNIVIVLPAIFSNDIKSILNFNFLIYFFVISMVISSTYIINDVKDADQDRLHPEKQDRPIASGSMSVRFAIFYSLTLLIIGLSFIFLTNVTLFNFLIFYILLTFSYSFKLKYVKFLDFISISLLFGIRLFLGSTLTSTNLSSYIIIFLIMFLTQLGIGKKVSIYYDVNIDPNTKLKSHLMSKYRESELKRLLLFFIFGSNWGLFLWGYEKFNINKSVGIYVVLVLVLFNLFSKNFYLDSLKSKTENFINWVFLLKNFIYLSVMFIFILKIIYF